MIHTPSTFLFSSANNSFSWTSSMWDFTFSWISLGSSSKPAPVMPCVAALVLADWAACQPSALFSLGARIKPVKAHWYLQKITRRNLHKCIVKWII